MTKEIFYILTMNKKAFTLSEVLITIGLLGIVMAMTLPQLIKNYQKKVTVERLKKAYSVISNAMEVSQHENGDMKYWNLSDMGDMSGGYSDTITNFLKVYILPYLKISQDCGIKCNAQKNIKRYTLSGTEDPWYGIFYYIVYLADGSTVAFMLDNDGHKFMGLYIYYDINGDQKPNIRGIDTFTFSFWSKADHAIRFAGWDLPRAKLLTTERSGCNVNAAVYAGDYCASLIVHDGWKISNDYPWK